jgi:hypothetical protein
MTSSVACKSETTHITAGCNVLLYAMLERVGGFEFWNGQNAVGRSLGQCSPVPSSNPLANRQDRFAP